MACVYKIILALIVVQVALVLAKPYKHEYDDGLYNSSDKSEKHLTLANFASFPIQ